MTGDAGEGARLVRLRSFVAVPLPAPVQAEVFAAAQVLARELPAVKWSRKVENLHITVKFLGPLTETQLGTLAAGLDEALRVIPRFGVEVRGLGAFPTARHANVVWAGVVAGGDARRAGATTTPPLASLDAVARAVEEVAARLGVPREQRPFRGHVTIGRCKTGVDARAALAPFGDRRFGALGVDEVHVYESRLGGDGSTYLLRSRAALGASGLN